MCRVQRHSNDNELTYTVLKHLRNKIMQVYNNFGPETSCNNNKHTQCSRSFIMHNNLAKFKAYSTVRLK
uniref:Uncharacterized protein n=1 Tax=Anguilla anguilla TaxID=7936 RepID=A0A0E9WLE5_ANGAN